MQYFPIELLDIVFSHLDPETNPEINYSFLCELRLLCKSFCRSLTPLVFRRLRLSGFNRDAFDRVIKLSQSALALYVTTFEYRIVEKLHPPDIHHVDALIHLEGSSPSAELAEQLIARNQQYLAQADVLGTYYDIISLTRALPAFRSLRSIVLSYADGNSWVTRDSNPTRAFWGIIKALQHCEFDIDALTIDAWHSGSLFPSDRPNQIRGVFENLKSLTLSNIPRDTRIDDWFEREIRDDILSECPFLETLKLEINIFHCEIPGVDNFHSLRDLTTMLLHDDRRCIQMHCNNCFDAYCRDRAYCMVFPHLRHLELVGSQERGVGNIDPVSLAHFMQANRHSLESVLIKRTRLRRNLTVDLLSSEIFRHCIQQNPGTKLMLEDVIDVDDTPASIPEDLEKQMYLCNGPCNSTRAPGSAN